MWSVVGPYPDRLPVIADFVEFKFQFCNAGSASGEYDQNLESSINSANLALPKHPRFLAVTPRIHHRFSAHRGRNQMIVAR
jgi:hypothetical protein